MIVEKGCETCREWQEHYYWEHMDLSKIRFFKLMTGDFAKGISIPEKFVKNFKKTKRVDLQAPSGDTWRIGVEKHDEELYLLSGWEDFVKAQEMKENDLLIFTCSGNSSFDVLIFEASGCVKVSSLFGPNMCKHFNNTAARQVEHHFLSDSDDTSMPSRLVRSANIASTSKKSRGREPDFPKSSSYKANRGKHDENYSLSDSVDTTTQSQLVGSPQGATTSQNYSGEKSRMMPESPNSTNDQFKREEIGEEDSDEEYSNPNYYYTMIANILLSDEEKEEVISLVPIRSDNPAFFTILQMSNVQRNNFLFFPIHFVADHLDSSLHEITLRRPNRKDKWCVKYYSARNSRGIRNYNFSKFMRQNKLRKGDICAFELMKGARRVTMTVHVIRKVDDRFTLVG